MSLGALALLGFLVAQAPAARAGFRMQEIAADLGVIYAVDVADMNRDRKPDIVAINNTQAMWFENPSFRKHVVFDGPASGSAFWKKDNVCFAIDDIDGDGHVDLALGADWQPTTTTSGGSVSWLQRDGRQPDAPWRLHPISEEPTVHRMRWADVDGDGRRELVVVPLHGRGTKGPGWDGDGLRVLVFRKPLDPARDPWLVEIADDSLHIGHNFVVDDRALVVASREGLHRLGRNGQGRWTKTRIGEGAPGEVKAGRRHLATIDPWHGNKLVIYAGGAAASAVSAREVIDDTLTDGHALGWGDFDGDGDDEVAAGWRKKPWGVAVYRRSGAGGWRKTMVDDGMATEDIAVADLDGDGRPEIVAGGRATSNIRIYWAER